jgi:hypothetical protein
VRLRLWTLLSLVPALALAQPAAILGPDGAVSPDGFQVALTSSQAHLEASGATVRGPTRAGPFAIFDVVPAAGAHEVSLTAREGKQSSTAKYEVGPPASRVKLSLDPAQPVKGRDQKATLTVELRRADGSIDPRASPPVLRANTGELTDLHPVAPGRFQATYQLPATRFPEVVVLVAFSAWPDPSSTYGTTGSLLVPLASAIDLPGTTEPLATMSIEIAGVKYGPTQAGADGRFKLPVVVPPGHRFGKGTAIDRVGNRRVAQVDLLLPPTDRLACVLTPARLPLGVQARARVLCATTDPYGKPMHAANVRLSATRGQVEGPRPAGEGLLEWTYLAPLQPSLSPDPLVATWKQGGPLSREELQVEFEAGAASAVALVPQSPVAFRGGSIGLRARVTGPLGWLRDGVVPELKADDGTFEGLHEPAPGVWEARWLPSVEGDEGKAKVRAHAEGPFGTEPHRIVVFADRGDLFAAVLDAAGLRVPGQPLVVDGQSAHTDARGQVRIGEESDGEHSIVHARWPGLALHVWRRDGAQFPKEDRPGFAQSELEVPIAPAVPVNVRIESRGREVTYWAEDANGRVIAGRPLTVRVLGGALEGAEAREGRVHGLLSSNGQATVVVRDDATGVTAIAEVGS